MRRLQVGIKVRLGGPLFRNPDHARVSHVCRNTIPFAAVLLSRCGHYRLGRFHIGWRALCTELDADHHANRTHIDPQIFRLTRRKSIRLATILRSCQPRFRQRKSQACLLFYSALPSLGWRRGTRITTPLMLNKRGVIAAFIRVRLNLRGQKKVSTGASPPHPPASQAEGEHQ